MNKLKMNPLVSAVIPTKNRADLLERTLSSVFNQTYKNIEIIVVDDGSTDRTSEVLARLKEDSIFPITILHNEESLGAAQARNQAVEVSKGEFIACLDDDDTWHEKRIEALLNAYSDDFCCVTSDMIIKYPHKTLTWRKNKTTNLETLLYTNRVDIQALIKKKRLLAVGGYDSELRAAQDYDVGVRLCEAYGPVHNVQKPLQTVYMDHGKERITNSASFYGYLQFYHKHKHRMNRKQRKYQLYKIRRAQGKSQTLAEFFSFVPPFRYWKELKIAIIRNFFE